MTRILVFWVPIQSTALAQDRFRLPDPLDYEQALKNNREAVLIDLRNKEKIRQSIY